jgi:peptidoglycan/LPS O-acetylase OafA/YrhL
MQTTNKNYRYDIDGLRAIAVLAVLINHLNSSLLPGGFSGVDIFFVISGFLITSQIYSGALDGSFSIKQFYKRRLNRIMPALLVLVFVCLLAGFFILSPADYIRLATSAPLSFSGLSNFYFWREYGNYFAGDTNEAILLHTWSLGVEEQFYLIWPLFLIFIFKLRYRYLLLMMIAIFISATIFSEYAVGVVASASYYLLPTRFFELMMGGILSIVMIRWNTTLYSMRYVNAAKITGYLLLLYSLLILNKDVSFPGLNALFPCLGSVLLIFSGSAGYQSKLLSNKVLGFLGLISYSLYLWHWPIIAYINYLNISIDAKIGGEIVIVSTILAWLSWRFIEKPFRYAPIQRSVNVEHGALPTLALQTKARSFGAELSYRYVLITRLVMPLMGLGMFWLAVDRSAGFPQRFDPMIVSYEEMAAAKPNIIREHCHVSTAYYQTKPNAGCVLGERNNNIDGLLIGDSYANHFSGMVDVLAKADGVQILDYTMDGCPPILGYENLNLQPSYRKKCIARNNYILNLIKENKYQYVILGASWPTDGVAGKAIEHTISEISKAGAKVVVIINNQTIAKASTCPIRQLMSRSREGCAVGKINLKNYWIAVHKHFPDVTFIDPNEVICSGQICNPVVNGTLLYRDSGHLNDIGSRLIGRKLAEKKHYFNSGMQANNEAGV